MAARSPDPREPSSWGPTFRSRVEWLGRLLPFRIFVAVLALFLHVKAMGALAEDRFGLEWNRAPDAEPAYPPGSESLPMSLPNWDRLLPARWDAQHYMELGVRGYEQCAPRESFDATHHPDDDSRCEMAFYPTYGFLGDAIARRLHWPIDVTMLRISLLASLGFMVLFTGRSITDRLGVGTTYLALLLMNVFTTGFTFVTIQTEPLLVFFLMASFVCLDRRWFVLGAVCAALASSVRVTGIAVSGAYAVGLLITTIKDRPSRIAWGFRALLGVVAFGGFLTLALYYRHRFGDPLAYFHAHERKYAHHANVGLLLHPDTRLLMQSIWAEPHDGVFLAISLLWFAMGHKSAFSTFPAGPRVFWYLVFFGIVGISAAGSSEYAFGGLTRYLFVVVPLFFAMASVMRRRPVLLAVWLYISIAHYWGGSLCFYVSQNEPDRLGQCGFAREFIQ